MKRKIVAVVLASTMVLGLAACGGGDAGTTDTTGGDDAAFSVFFQKSSPEIGFSHSL